MNRFFHRFTTDQQGSVLVMFGLTVLLLVIAGGMALDLGKQQVAQSQLQYAADAAATSGASVASGDRQQAASRYFNMNAKAYGLGAGVAPSINVSDDKVIVTADANVATDFLSNAGITSMGARGSSEAGITYVGERPVDIILLREITPLSRFGGGPTNATNPNMAYYGDYGDTRFGPGTPIHAITKLATQQFIADTILPTLNDPEPNRVGLHHWGNRTGVLGCWVSGQVMGDINEEKCKDGIRTNLTTNIAQLVVDMNAKRHKQMEDHGPTYGHRALAHATNYMNTFRPDVGKGVIILANMSNNTGFNLPACSSIKGHAQLFTIWYEPSYNINPTPEHPSQGGQVPHEHNELQQCATQIPGESNKGKYYFNAHSLKDIEAAFVSIRHTLQNTKTKVRINN